MKRFLTIVSVTIAIMGFMTAAIASIEGSPHDMSGKQCNFCHTPKSDSGDSAQWNASKEYGDFGLYNEKSGDDDNLQKVRGEKAHTPYHSATSDMSDSHELGTQSLLCLGCHNGIFSQTIKAAKDTDNEEYAFEAPLYAMINKQAELNNDHPVGFSYIPRKDLDMNNFPEAISVQGKSYSRAIMGKSGALYPLYGMSHDRFECITCHNPHYDPGNSMRTSKQASLLLRVDNASSRMCRDCHIGKY